MFCSIQQEFPPLLSKLRYQCAQSRFPQRKEPVPDDTPRQCPTQPNVPEHRRNQHGTQGCQYEHQK
jgi:hypothetical protein